MSKSSLNQPTVTDDSPAFELRGNRFKPLAWENMSAEQQGMTRAVLEGQRGNMQGPYNVLLRSPELGQLAQAFGCLLYTSPSPRDRTRSRMPSSA